MSETKDVLLVGFGAIGAVVGFVLQRIGKARVTVVARSNYEALKVDGLTFRSTRYEEHVGWKPHRLCSSIKDAADQPYHYVIVTAKAVPEVQRTPELLAPLLAPSYAEKYPQPVYCLLQNGLNVEVDLYNALKALSPSEEPKIISSAVYIASRLSAPNAAEHSDVGDRLGIGMYRPIHNVLTNSPEEEATLTQFASLFGSNVKIDIAADIQRVKFIKNIWNSVFGPIATLSRYTLNTIFRPAGDTRLEHGGVAQSSLLSNIPYSYPPIRDYTLPFVYETLSEVIHLGNVRFPPDADGKPALDPNLAKQTLEFTAGIFSLPTSSERPSILVDCETGRPMEVEVIVGEVVRMGRALNVPMPRMETFYSLLLVVQMQLLHAKGRN
ncbi:ketopantoate reductase PanE/ApbA-domain-containing protein [Abortiporus biennis]|nr:ketopantoate reductase PanE/ApbA-domain-containing protein [Abortiporus biennis]